jgi:DnaK suppressor protein
VTTISHATGLALPAWRSLLEARWRQRLDTLTELSLAYHEAAERSGDAYNVDGLGETPQLKWLLREATAARRVLCDTEEALVRLSDGSYGRCEQCSAAIPARELRAEPEIRYCAECVQAARWLPKPGEPRPSEEAASGTGQDEPHRGSLACGARGGEHATVRAGQLSRDREPDAAAGGLRSARSAPEPVKDAGQVFSRDADAGVGDFEDGVDPGLPGADGDAAA